MKSNTKKRLIAFMLCMVLVLSSATSAFADELQDTESQNQVETMAEPETQAAVADEPVVTSLDDSTDGQQPVAEAVENEPEHPAAETPAQNTEEVAPQTNDTQSEAADQSNISSEENNASNEIIECEATQLKQEADNGNDTKTTVVADIPAGAFHAYASEITMEVKRLSTEDVEDAAIVKLIKNALTTKTSLSNYVLYDVVFKVNGVETEPLKSIDVNFKGSELKVKDTKKATAFYFAPAKSEDGIEEDRLVELPQREDKIKELLDAETDKTREQIEDEFDFSELSVKDEVADELKMEVRKNRVYGCYVVEDKKETSKTKDSKKSFTNTTLTSNDAIASDDITDDVDTYADSSKTYTVRFWRNDKNTGGTDTEISTLSNLTASTDSNGNTVVEVDLSGKKATSSGNGYVFYGWSTTSNANSDAKSTIYCGDASTKITYGSKEQTVFTYGGKSTTTFSTSDFDSSDNTLNLYAVYAVDRKNATTDNVGTKTVSYYIRLDGKVPKEPFSYGKSDYTGEIDVSNALYYYQHIYNNSDVVKANLAKEPTNDEIKKALQNKNKTFDPTTQYVEWYVVKYEGDRWHVDGALMSKQKWTLRYDANTNDAVPNIIPASQYDYSTNATVKNTQDPTTGSQVDAEPVRTGYTFTGWNTASDGTGVSFTKNNTVTVDNNGKVYKNETDTGKTISKDSSTNTYSVTLYAQWTKNYTPPTPTITVDKKLSHEKYIKKNYDGTYDLTLNVSGAVRTEEYANKLDILFVLDTSNSMAESMSYFDSTTKFTTQESAVRNAVTTLTTKEGVDARFAIVSFDTMAGTNSSWTESKDANKLVYPDGVGKHPGKYMGYDDYPPYRYHEKTRAAGGTNYKEGLKEANKLLTSARTDAAKIVVFLSDGDPTFYTDDSNYVYGNGGSYDSNALDQAKTFLGTMTNMQYFYTVGIGSKNDYAHLKELRNGIAQGQNIQTNNFDGTNADNLKNAFDTIIRDATSILCSNVTVTDTLSEYAELADSTATPVITIKDEDGNKITHLKRADGTITENISECITANIVTENNKTKVVMKTVGNYKLEAGYTYYVTVKIKPTDAAYAYYQEHGEGPHTGDPYTDEYTGTDKKPTHDTITDGTSSNKNGFHSNESAQVTYTYDGKTPTEDYKHPVIQVTPEVVNHTVEKKWVSTLTNHSGVTVKLKAYVTEGIEGASTENPVYLTSDDCKLLPTEDGSTVELSVTNTWSKTWENLPKYYYYRDNDVIQKTLIHYSAVEKNVPDGYEASVTDSSDGLTTTITNIEVTADLDIKKVTKGSGNEIDGAEFTLYKKEGAAYKKVTDFTVKKSTSTPELTKLAPGDYYLEETKAPVGCSLLGEKIYFCQSQGTITLTDKDGNALTSTPTMWNLSKKDNTFTLTIKNDVVYNLPSTGGSGIYLYMIGGILLMFAAAWILYKNKCREVLER